LIFLSRRQSDLFDRNFISLYLLAASLVGP
jgi:hypothetical protein